MELKKNPKVDVNNKRVVLLEIGLCLALLAVIAAFLYAPKEVVVEEIDMNYGPVEEQITEIEERVNAVIAQHMPVTIEFVSRDNVPAGVDLGKLPADARDTLRIVRVGDYDTCACIGAHVENTSEIGTFRIISHSFENGTLRLRFKLA